MISVSGIRGIVGESLTPQTVQRYARAFACYVGQKPIVVGRDARPSGYMLQTAVSGALIASGCDVLNAGLCPTPTVQLAVEKQRAGGGIIISASHNPGEWNALKFVGPDGLFLNQKQSCQLMAGAETDQGVWEKRPRLGQEKALLNALDDHLERVLNLSYLDLPALRRRRFRVVVDGCNSVGGLILPRLLGALGCEVTPIYCEASGAFQRGLEPLAENLESLARSVPEHVADIGFATDPDGDRLALVSELGRPIGEEYTVSLASWFILQKKTGPVVVNLSTTRLVDDIAAYHGVPVIRTRVGEIHVAESMRRVGAVIGGEGNGGVILPDAHYGRDAVVGTGLILQALLEWGKPLEDLLNKLPRYYMLKNKVTLPAAQIPHRFDRLTSHWPAVQVDPTDGLKFSWDRSWVHVRASNTEPVVRIITEAPSLTEARDLAEETTRILIS